MITLDSQLQDASSFVNSEFSFDIEKKNLMKLIKNEKKVSEKDILTSQNQDKQTKVKK